MGERKPKRTEQKSGQEEFQYYPARRKSRWGLRGKTFWDWLSLLLVPLVLGIGAAALTAWFNAQQDMRQTKIENNRAEVDRQIEEQRAQDEALQAYLGQMSTLLIEKHLRTSEQSSEVRTLARARTLTVLGRLDASRKTAVMRFLEEAGLVAGFVQPIKDPDPDALSMAPPVISLKGADLQAVHLSDQGVVPNLEAADLEDADLEDAHLEGIQMGAANLSRAHLEDAHLEGAYLTNTNLSKAHLGKAHLSKALMDDANLTGATGWTEDQLTTVRALDGATMPDGQILKSYDNPVGPTFEEWLKDREDRKDAKNE